MAVNNNMKKVLVVLFGLFLIVFFVLFCFQQINYKEPINSTPRINSIDSKFKPLINSTLDNGKFYILRTPKEFNAQGAYADLFNKVSQNGQFNILPDVDYKYIIFDVETSRFLPQLISTHSVCMITYSSQGINSIFLDKGVLYLGDNSSGNRTAVDTSKFNKKYDWFEIECIKDDSQNYNFAIIKAHYTRVENNTYYSETDFYHLNDSFKPVLKFNTLNLQNEIDKSIDYNNIYIDENKFDIMKLEGGLPNFIKYYTDNKNFGIFHTSVLTEKIWFYNAEKDKLVLVKDSNQLSQNTTIIPHCNKNMCYIFEINKNNKAQLYEINQDGLVKIINLENLNLTNSEVINARILYTFIDKMMFVEDSLLKINVFDKVVDLKKID